jgi:hypothetical protein
MLATAIAEYKKLHVPSAVAALDKSLTASLAAELRAVRTAAAATAGGDSARLAAAEKLDAHARADVSKLLGRIAVRVNGCRNNAARC